MAKALVLDADREVYGMDDVETMTIGELIRFLQNQDLDENTPVILRHDRGYTYGGIRKQQFEVLYETGLDEYGDEIEA